ncbi:MAG TPA: two-component regulator propeller domain-containing protein, partial [Ferruginibacter sp.]|nr:two-component regulator propeller domain-containing protein [Ferruginibacter sp.]
MYRIITILLFFLPAIAAGQIPVIFQHLNSAHGLSDNNVNAIVSDKNGFLWVGTDKGLNVYDGKTVSLFAKSNSGSFVAEEITALFCDSFNRVWVGTPAGVVLIDEKRQMKKVELSDTFKNYSVKEILYTQSLGIIIFSNKGNFFFNTNSKRWEKIQFFSQQQFKNRAVDISSFGPNQILMCDEFESILLVDFVQRKEVWRLPVKYVVTAARLNDSTILASTFTGIIYFINS